MESVLELEISVRGAHGRLLRLGVAILMCLSLSVVPAAQVNDLKGGDSLAPARPHGIGGVGGFKTISTIEFVGLENAPHEWTAIYAFPDRARWTLKPTTGKPTSPMIVQRFGARSWTIAAGQARSVADDLDGPRTTLIQMELRRALVIWPLGFDWKDREQGPARAEVYRLQQHRDKPPIGYLEANRDEQGELLSMSAFHVDGTPIESLDILSWREFEGRRWPAEMVLSKSGQDIWKETLTYASARGYHSDLLFTPPDRRKSPLLENPSSLKTQHVDLPQVTQRLRPLRLGTNWKRALKIFAKEWKATQKRLAKEGYKKDSLDPVPAFQVDAKGQPTHLIIRFLKPVATPPKGWVQVPTRPAVGIAFEGLGALDSAMVKGIRSKLPRAAKPGVPYCRVLGAAGKESVQLYLPAGTQ